MAQIVDFPEYAPDLTAIGTPSSPMISGVTPRSDGYGPWKSLLGFTQALPAVCRGQFFARRNDGSIVVFAGTSTELYLLSNTDFSWTNVSKATYSALPSTDNWTFAQFADTVIACQINTVLQSYVLASSSDFADLAGSPPQASHVAVIGGFLVLTGLSSQTKRIQWSDLYGITIWTAGVGLSDFQDLPDGGGCLAVAGGDLFGVIFQDDVIRRMLYVPGSAAIFNIVRISTNDALVGRYSSINAGTKTFFHSAQGFRMIEAGGTPVHIGKERVDRTFDADLDTGNLQLLLGSIDPTATRVYWAYKSIGGNAGLFDKIMCFDWSIGKTGRWTVIPASGEYLAALSKPGLTLENLDQIAPTSLNVTGTANNGSGAIRLAVNALSNAYFSLGAIGNPSQNNIVVYGVGGTTEANGSWPYTVIDATHIDLTGSTYTNAYTSGGHIGGSLDALPFSLDSVSTAAITQLAAVDSTHKAGFFAGDNSEAILETSEFENDGDMTFVSSVRPITDCAGGMVSIAYRNIAQAASSYSTETAIDTSQGQAPCLVEARYTRGRLRNPSGAAWTFAKGMQPEAQPAGEI